MGYNIDSKQYPPLNKEVEYNVLLSYFYGSENNKATFYDWEENFKKTGRSMPVSKDVASTILHLHCIGMIYKEIQQYVVNKSLDIDALYGAGAEGITVALNKYDLCMENKFSTYAYMWIRQKIGREAIDSGIIRKPVYIVEKERALNKLMRELEVALERPITYDYLIENSTVDEKGNLIFDDELSDIVMNCKNFNITASTFNYIVDSYKNGTSIISLDDPIENAKGDENATLLDLYEDDNEEMKKLRSSLKSVYQASLEKIKQANISNDVKENVLKLYTLIFKDPNLSQEDLSQLLNMSKEKVNYYRSVGRRILKKDNDLHDGLCQCVYRR